MAFKNASRVRETVSNLPNAVTAFNLSGAVTSGRTFVAGVGTTNTCMYCTQAVDATGANEAAWEIGVGTVTSGTPDTLTRTQIIESSNADAAVDFSTSTKIEIFTVDAAANLDAGGGIFNAHSAGIYHYPLYQHDVALTACWANGNSEQTYWPMVVPKPIIITALACDVMGAGGTAQSPHRVRMGIHNSEDGLPTTLRYEGGTVDGDTAAFKELTGLNYFLPPGNYFLTVQTEGANMKLLGYGSNGEYSNTGMWEGFGVNPAARNKALGALTEGGPFGSFGASMTDAGTHTPPSRTGSFCQLLMYKFSEV